MSRQWGQRVEVIIGQEALPSNEFDIEFDVELTDNVKLNHAEVLLYNLSRDRVNRIAYGNPLIINAGYENDTGGVFFGAVYEADTVKNGVDRETTVRAVDAKMQNAYVDISRTYKAGIRASQIITDLARFAGYSIGTLILPVDKQYRSGKVITDVPVVKAFRDIAKDCGAKFMFLQEICYFRPKGSGEDINYLFSPERGLIGSPEPFVEEDEDGVIIKGYNVKTLLNHRIQPDHIIEIQSKNVNGKYRVRKANHQYDGTEMITEMEVVE